MSVTLSEVKRAAKARRAPLAGESAGYLILAIADQVLSAPRVVEGADIELTEEGTLRVLSGKASSDAEAEFGLRRALDQLLLVASSGSAALARASRRTTPTGLAAMVRELEAALIPVNRAAARRALARVQRETARALASGALPAEELEQVAELSAPAAPLTPALLPLTRAVLPPAVALVPVSVEADRVADGVLSALSAEWLAPAELQESDARTVALEVGPIPTVPVVEAALEFDVELEAELEVDAEAVDPDEAPTMMRAVAVQPVVLGDDDGDDDGPTELPPEARTRPEPAIIRKSLRALLPEGFLLVPEAVVLPHTPTLGSLAAQLPVLDPAELAPLLVETKTEAAEVEPESADELTVVTSARVIEMGTERMPEVAPLSPGVAMVASKKSDVTELLSSFQVAPVSGDETNQGLCRAIKEMAELDLTPAPFAALIR
jgi:hypothetical protein